MSPDLPSAAVERGAKALAQFNSRLDDPEAVELVAKALYELEWAQEPEEATEERPLLAHWPWPNLPEFLNTAAYRNKARAAIAALLGAEDDG